MNKEVISMLKDLGYPISFIKYTGTEDTYIVFNFVDERGSLFADDRKQEETYYMQIHFFCPLDFDFNDLKEQIKILIEDNGWTYPSTHTEKEEDYFHVIFETEKDI